MTARLRLKLSATLTLGAIFCVASLPAQATEGYFQHGYGAISKALAGTGAAYSQDASSMATNPAGLVNVDNQVNFDVSFFSPHRSFTGSGASGFPFAVPTGSYDSENTLFFVPTAAVSYRIDDVSTAGVALYGNGGMNTEWKGTPRPASECPPSGGLGVYCAGKAGVDLTQIFLQPTYAREIFDGVSVGVGPIFAAQFFQAHGVQSFQGFSSDPNNLSNNGHDESYGIGARFGIQAQLPANVRIGAAYQLRTFMTQFHDYAGLFAEQGAFDIPPALQVGLSWQPMDNLTLLLDYRRIWYSDVDSVGNPGPASFADIATRGLGGDNSVGFGWDNINIIKVGAQFQPDDQWTLRAGFAYNENPIDSSEVMFNILAPGVVKYHITGGVEYKLNDAISLLLSGMYAPSTSVSGPNPFNPAQTIKLEMYQYEVTAGLAWRF